MVLFVSDTFTTVRPPATTAVHNSVFPMENWGLRPSDAVGVVDVSGWSWESFMCGTFNGNVAATL